MINAKIPISVSIYVWPGTVALSPWIMLSFTVGTESLSVGPVVIEPRSPNQQNYVPHTELFLQLFQMNYWRDLRILPKCHNNNYYFIFLCHNYDLELCFSYFFQAHHNSWIKYDKFDSSHWRGFICTADARVQRAFVFQQPLFLGRAFISKNDHAFSLLPTFPPISPQFLQFSQRAPENVFILSLNEDVSKQLGNK